MRLPRLTLLAVLSLPLLAAPLAAAQPVGTLNRIGYLRAGVTPSVERPTKFDPTVNLKTAKALRLTIPPSVLARV